MDIGPINQKYADTNKDEVIKRGDSANFAEAEKEIERIYQWEADYFSVDAYREQLPLDNRTAIENEFLTAINQFQEIATLRRTNVPALMQEKESRIASIKTLYRTIYEQFVKDYRGWKTENQGAEYSQRIENIVQQANAAVEQTLAAEKKVKAREKEVAGHAAATREATQEIGLSELAKYFYQLVKGDNDWMKEKKGKRPNGDSFFYKKIVANLRGYAGAARIWLLLAIISIGITAWVAHALFTPFVQDLTITGGQYADKTTGFVYAVLTAKALVLLAPFYAIRFCLKNYGSNKHLAVDALHKAKTLQTLSAYLAISRDDKAATREIAVAVAQLVFTSTDSGFIAKKGDYESPSINITNPLKS
jgi:hypothetical protein